MNTLMTPEATTPRRSRAGRAACLDITAWFGDHKVLDRVSLTMPAGRSPR